MSSCGREQQINRFPTAGASSGSGSYFTDPETSPHSQVWQTPVRQDQRTGTSQASASSNRLWNLGSQETVSPARANEILGPLPRRPGRRVRWPARRLLHTRRDGLARTENLRVDAITGHAPIAKSGGEVLKEGGRAAQIKIGFAGYAQLFEDSYGQPAGRIEVEAQSVSRDQAGCTARGSGLG